LISAVVDNDVLIKGASYRLLDRALSLSQLGEGKRGILGAAPFVVRNRLNKRPPKHGALGAISSFEAVLPHFDLLEPSDAEAQLAAELEYEAQGLGTDLDTGESLLAAIVLARGISCFATGDKRAIAALGRLAEVSVSPTRGLVHRIACLEQLMLWLTAIYTTSLIKGAVCAEKEVDRALSICFSCSSPEVDETECLIALCSYIEDLKMLAGDLLFDSS
jgi:hypothetical protein